MTVRDLVTATRNVKDIDVYIADDAFTVVGNTCLNNFALDLVGDYLVDRFFVPEDGKMIIEVKVIPVKAG